MVGTPTQAPATVPGSRPLTALEEAVMAACWAAGEPLTTAAVRAQLDYSGAVGRHAVGNTLRQLHRVGYLTRQRLDGRMWQYVPYCPLADHLAVLIASLLERSPDRGATLRLALAGIADVAGAEVGPDVPGVLAATDLATLRRFAAAVWGTRNAFHDTAGLFRRRAEELTDDHVAAAMCLGQAKAYASAAEHIGETVAVATGRWDLVTEKQEP